MLARRVAEIHLLSALLSKNQVNLKLKKTQFVLDTANTSITNTTRNESEKDIVAQVTQLMLKFAEQQQERERGRDLEREERELERQEREKDDRQLMLRLLQGQIVLRA